MSDSIDISYDVRTDAHGKDPDSANAVLRRYHKLLWSKKLPEVLSREQKEHKVSNLLGSLRQGKKISNVGTTKNLSMY